VNSSDIAKFSPATGQLAEAPKKKSELRQILAIALIVFLTDYFRIRFNNWFGLSNPSAFALAVFLSWTLAWFVDRPRKLWGFEPKRPVLTYFLSVVAIALASFLVGRIWHF
jgi:hypothetical protein